VASGTVQLAVGETKRIENLYDFLHAADGAGMLRLTGEVIAWVRTFNQGAQGTFGQDLTPISPEGGYAPGTPVFFPFSTAVDLRKDFRSNLLLVNLESTAVKFTVSSGTVAKEITVSAGAYTQIDNLGAWLGTPAGFRTAGVVANGRWAGSISTIDPVTGDPTTVRGLEPHEVGERLFAGVAKASGNLGTSWRSEVTLFNPSDTATAVTLTLIPRGSGTPTASKVLTLAAGETRRLADVYDTLGVSSGAGTLRVVGGALAWVRTFNQGAQGTFGQDLPPVVSIGSVAASIPVALPLTAAASIQTGFRSNLLLQNLENRPVIISLRAAGKIKTTTVPAGAYVQVDDLGTFLSLVPGVHTVWIQGDGRWSGNVSTIDPVTGDPTTFRAEKSFLPPTSYDLIQGALAAATISPEQAVMYKVFADFADSRLPATLRGDDRNLMEGLGTQEAAALFSSLSPATQEVLGPFLAQPFYQGSWWDLRRRNQGATLRPTFTDCRPWATACSLLNDWDYVDGPNVRIWYLKDYQSTDWPTALDLVAAANSDIWPKLLPSIGHHPKPDGEEGGNPLLDVVLTDGLGEEKLGITLPTALLGCTDTSAYILLNRNVSSRAILKSILAYEIFHAAQFAVPSKQCSPEWLGEGTAMWFEDYVYPTLDREHGAAPHYLEKVHLSLDNDGGNHLKNYGAYLFFYYLTGIRGLNPRIIGKIWDATINRTALEALDYALRQENAPLEVTWPKFAVSALNWEAPPFDGLRTRDRLKDQAKAVGPRSGSLQQPSATWYIAPKEKLKLPHLSIQYYYYQFPDSSAANVVVFNGLTRALDKISVEDYGNANAYSAAPLPGNAPAGAKVTGVFKINGNWGNEEDLTDKPFKIFCRDLRKERVEEMVLIFSNASVEESVEVQPQGQLPPLIYATNIGCAAWEGEAHLTYRWGDVAVVEKMDVTNVRLEPMEGFVGPDENTPLSYRFIVSGGGFAYSVSGSDGSCSYSAGFSSTLSSTLRSSFFTPAFVLEGPGYRGLLCGLFWEWLEPRFIVEESCPWGTRSLQWNAGLFFLAAIPEWTWARFAPDGRSLTVDVSKIPEATGLLSGTWTFRALREP
jgi:hypothetical protein